MPNKKTSASRSREKKYTFDEYLERFAPGYRSERDSENRSKFAEKIVKETMEILKAGRVGDSSK